MNTKIPTLLALLLIVLPATAAAQQYTYDASGRLTRVTYAEGTTISYTYDAGGNAISTSVTPTPPGGGGSGGCFIATAAYGSFLDPHVQDLRDFRDAWLLTNAPGRWLVGVYERTSPPLAEAVAASPSLRFATRLVLTPVVLAVVWPRTFLLTLVGLVLLRHRRRRARARLQPA